MQIRWKSVVLGVALALGVIAFATSKRVTAASQSAAPAKAAKAASPVSALAVSIPDTTLAINSPTPVSQRIVHYEIDAKYDAAKHTVDATEVLTYHNLTGQA